jgi:hypothetical protein
MMVVPGWRITFAQDDWHFVDESSSRLPSIETYAFGLDGGDVDGDGSIDLLAGCLDDILRNWPGFEQLFLNDAAGYFSLADSSRFPWADDITSTVLLFDCDSDADLDAFVANINYATDYIAINDGAGLFIIDPQRVLLDSVNAQKSDYADIDDDGDIDICVLNNDCYLNEQHALWMNDGSGFYQNQNQRLPSLPSCHNYIEFADVDGDLDPDILVLAYYDNGRPALLINDGRGFYTDETGERLPPTDSLGYRPTAKFMDVDADGDFDISLATEFECLFLTNDGTGYYSGDEAFRGASFAPGPGHLPHDLGIADLDNDGLNDMVVGLQEDHNYIFINISGGYFEDQTEQRLPIQYLTTRKLMVADLDGDGDADIFRDGTGFAMNSIYINTLNAPDSFPPYIMNQTIFPEYDTVAGPYPVKLVAKDGVSICYELSVAIHYSTDGISFRRDSLHFTGGYTFYGTIPQFDSGQTIYYYYSAGDRYGNVSKMPSNAPDSLFSFICLNGHTGIVDRPGVLPDQLSISAYPNPFNGQVNFEVGGLKGGNGGMKIFDIKGGLIRVIDVSEGKATWDATDNTGKVLSSGIYFARVETPQTAKTARLLLLK